MRFLLRPSLLVLLVMVMAGCHGRGRETRGGGGGGGTDGGGGGGGTSCDDVCDNAEALGTADPDCAVDRAECDSTCPSLEESVRACLAEAATCADALACAGGGGGTDAGTPGTDAGGGGGGELCSDTCTYAGDGECDDGGEGSTTSVCEYGTDCTDCGPRPADI